MNSLLPVLISTGISLLIYAIGWISSVAVSKQEIKELNQKLVKVNDELVKVNTIAINTSQDLLDRVRAIEADNTRCDENRRNIHISLDRLEEVKASKELVDTLRSDVHNLSASMEKGFEKLENKIETMISRVMGNNKSSQ